MSKSDNGKARLGFRFVALPSQVLESPEYRALPDSARSLLTDLMLQFSGGNNGRLTPSITALRRYGWLSSSKLNRAKKALLECPFVVLTRKGCPPRKAEWIGVTWMPLNYDKSMDVDPRLWPYRNFLTLTAGAIDPNIGRERQFVPSRIRTDRKSSPGKICPESGQLSA